MAWTTGRWRSSMVCTGRVEPCGAPKGASLVEGVSEAAITCGRLVEEKAAGNGACPGVVASGLGS
jgi:hypothetical protein